MPSFAIAFAFSSYNLFHLSKANIAFIREFGFEAIRLGALVQLVQILLGGCFALFCYIGFKLCENEMVARYQAWKLDAPRSSDVASQRDHSQNS